jgi:Protein of unknown function (DUF4229)
VNATLRYSLMRLGIFVGCFVLLAVLARFGVIPAGIGKSNPLWLFLLAVVVSAPLSLVLLRKQRDEMSAQLAPRVERMSGNVRGKLSANRDQEDGAV